MAPERFGGRYGRYTKRIPPVLADFMDILKNDSHPLDGRSGRSEKRPPTLLAVVPNEVQES
jgi:hypothetical protein